MSNKVQPPYITRIVEEQGQLNERIQKLEEFMNSDKFYDYNITQQQRFLMENQLLVMRLYSRILEQRMQ